jgi:predicted HTH transcriptional regulator
MKLEAYLKQGEVKTLEFKETPTPKSKILPTAIDFANTSGGHIIIGVEDKTHYVFRIDNPHAVAESLENLPHDRE